MNGFHKVSYKTRVFKRKFNGEKNADISLSFVKTQISAVGIAPVKIYDVNGNTYVYCTDKSLQKIVNNALVTMDFTSNTVPLVVPITLNGIKTLLLVSDSTAVAGETSVSGIPYGTSSAFCGGRLFIADGDKIKYSGEFDFTDFSVGLTFGGFIALDGADGEILYLAEDAGKLYAIAEHAVYRVSPYGEQFEFVSEKLSTFRLDVKKDTVYQTGNAVGFISGDDFCVLSGGKVKREGTAISGYLGGTFGIAGGFDGFYVLPVSVGAKRYAYVYDTETGTETLRDVSGFTVAGGYAAKTNDAYLYKLAVGGKPYGGEYDFGSCAKKSVLKVEAHITGSADIVVSGDGVFRATLTEKCNAASCFVHGRVFAIDFENASADFKPISLAVHYVIHGE